MAWFQARLDRLRQIVASLAKRGITPQNVGFADYVTGYIASNFGLRPETVKAYIKTLVHAWNYNHWLSYIKYNKYLTEGEKEKWMKKHSKTRS